MNSVDAISQLTAAVHFCATGDVAASQQLGPEFVPRDFRYGATTSTYYNGNDLGGSLLMLPAACVAIAHGAHDVVPVRGGRGTPDDPSLAKELASLTYALAGGLGVVFVMLALAELVPLRRAWWWSLAFLFATGYLAYLKSAWDVLPAAVAVAALTWIAVRAHLRLDPPSRTLYGAAVAVGLAALFRYTLLPFVLSATLLALAPTLARSTKREAAGPALVLFLLVLPDCIYNAVRSGSPWVPGEAARQFGGGPHLTLHYLLSVPGLFFGFGGGLLFFAPVCALGCVVAILRVADTRLGNAARLRWLAGVLSVIAYAVVVSVAHRWNVFGWGPRYLVPWMPVMFVLAALGAELGLIPRSLAYISVAVGLAVELALVVGNWKPSTAVVGIDPRVPDPIIGLWRSVLHGVVHGAGIGQASDPRALAVPDVWWAHVLTDHGVPYPLELAIVAVALTGVLWIVARTLPPTHASGGPTRRTA